MDYSRIVGCRHRLQPSSSKIAFFLRNVVGEGCWWLALLAPIDCSLMHNWIFAVLETFIWSADSYVAIWKAFLVHVKHVTHWHRLANTNVNGVHYHPPADDDRVIQCSSTWLYEQVPYVRTLSSYNFLTWYVCYFLMTASLLGCVVVGARRH